MGCSGRYQPDNRLSSRLGRAMRRHRLMGDRLHLSGGTANFHTSNLLVFLAWRLIAWVGAVIANFVSHVAALVGVLLSQPLVWLAHRPERVHEAQRPMGPRRKRRRGPARPRH